MSRILQKTWIFIVLLFMYAPILVLAVYSFTSATMLGNIRSFSVENYITLFTTPELISMIVGTVVLAIAVALTSTLLGTIGAIGNFYSHGRIRKSVELINQIPVVNADVVTAFSICILLVVGQTALCVPFVYLSVMPRLRQMDNALYEAALDLGCTPSQALIKVTIPQLVPGIVSGFITSITLSLDDYFIATYTKPATFDTISTYVVNATKGAQTKIKTALWALSTVIFVLVVLFVMLNNKTQKKEVMDR